MEATSLKKKSSMSKSKLKKTIKNVVCRPDTVHWPLLNEVKGKTLFQLLVAHKVEIPKVVKPHWKELKLLPKEKRPKPPKIQKVKGMLFGISECSENIQKGECCAILIESKVNPPTIVHPIIENCLNHKIPIVCLEGLRKFSLNNFGIPTSCLGIKKDYHKDIISKATEFHNEILSVRETNKPKQVENIKRSTEQNTKNTNCNTNSLMENELPNPYLFRNNKKARVFTPPSERNNFVRKKEFIGQDFITFSNNVEEGTDRKSFMKMIVKRISNNEHRKKPKIDQGK